MMIQELWDIVTGCVNDITFCVDGTSCGITPEMQDRIATFEVWCGDWVKTYDDVDVLMQDRIFCGKSLCEIVENTEFNVL